MAVKGQKFQNMPKASRKRSACRAPASYNATPKRARTDYISDYEMSALLDSTMLTQKSGGAITK